MTNITDLAARLKADFVDGVAAIQHEEASKLSSSLDIVQEAHRALQSVRDEAREVMKAAAESVVAAQKRIEAAEHQFERTLAEHVSSIASIAQAKLPPSNVRAIKGRG